MWNRLFQICVGMLLFVGIRAGGEEVMPFEKAIGPFLEDHCVRCHGEKKQKGHFRVDTLSSDFVEGHDAEMWLEVVMKLGGAEMPPEDEPQPEIAESDRVMDWLSDRIREGEAARLARRPPVAHYRLSREEYANTIYDLLGVHYDPRAPGEFSPDPEWHGFERIGSELSLSPSHIEKYLKAAEEIVSRAYPDKELRHLKTHRDALDIDWHNRQKRKELEEIGVAEHVRTLIWPGHKLSYLRPDGGHQQEAGVYRARMQLSGLAPEGRRPPHVALYSKKLDRMIFEADVLAPEDKPVILEFDTFIPKGQIDITINNEVPGPSNSGRSGRPAAFVFTTLDDPKSRAPWQRKMTDDEGEPLYPFLIFDWIEWEGPVVSPEEMAKREAFFPVEGSDLEKAKAYLEKFAATAWRRPVKEGEIDRYVQLVKDLVDSGEDFRSAYKSGLVGILASKNFFYLAEGSPEKKRMELNDWELASRLSYFLWSSQPDKTLRELAAAGKLKEPEVLHAQFQRMIEDPKIERFLGSFPHQWLRLGKVGMFPPDEKLYPDYDTWLEQSMVLETKEYFAEVFRKDLPIREFLNSDWTMLNPRLAYHYELPIPKSAGFERVALKPEDHRGGILTQGSILSLSSDGTRHRPVHRGVWVSESIFGKTPPPPPANVSAIEPNPVDQPKATIRMKLDAHKQNENCAACHAKIDPLGLAFDNYDAIGRWRTEEVVPNGSGDNPVVDASGVLPDGRAYETPDEFKELLCEDVEPFASTIVEKLANYGLRRAMTVDDRDDVGAIVGASEEGGYRLRSIVENIVLSELFRRR